MDWALLAEFSLIGLATGGVYSLIGLSFTLVFKATGVFNFATGAIMMIGTYLFVMALGWGFGIVIALLFAIVVMFVFGGSLERVLFRPMIGQSAIALVMVTVGLGSILEGAAALIWSTQLRLLPEIIPRTVIDFFGIPIPSKTAASFVIASVLVLLTVAILRYTSTGTAVRATASSSVNAMAVGINVPVVFSGVWGVSAVIATISGLVVASINGLTPDIGDAAFAVLAVVILAGMDSVAGVLIAGLIIGWVEIMTGAYLGGKYREIVPYIAVLSVLMFRPHGLFGSAEVERI